MGTDIHLQLEAYDEETKSWNDINKEALPYRGTLDGLWDNRGDEPKKTEREIQDMIFEYWNNNQKADVIWCSLYLQMFATDTVLLV